METIKIDKNELLKLYNCPENIKPYIYGNRLIGLFMGKTHLNKLTILYSLKYHESWDWLMPVVEKIEGLTDGIYQVDILQEGCQIKCRCKYFIDKTVGKLPIGTTKIESVWLAIIEFIKLHNNKPKE